jgi:hypothetical protein
MRLPVASYNQPSRVPTRILNCYAAQTPGKQQVELLSVPGVIAHATYSEGGRGLHVMRGRLYGVVGTTLYLIPETGAPRDIGTMPGTYRLQFADDGTNLVTDTGYIYDGSTIEIIQDPDKSTWAAVGYSDGRIVAVDAGTQKFVASGLYDPENYDGLDFASAEGAPDSLLTLIVDHRQVVLLGTSTIELWWNSGANAFPYERLSGGFIEIGCLARRGVAKADNSVYWLASDRTIRRLTGSTPVRVSQHGVEEAIAKYTDVASCEAFSFTWNGHVFVVFRFAEGTWVLDATTGEWHERESYGSPGWDVCSAVHCYGKVWVQHENGSIGYLSDGANDEFGQILRRAVSFPSVYDQDRRITHSEFEAVFATGSVGAGLTPYIDLEISDDGGNNWQFMPRRELGRTGEYRRVVRWHRLGQARDRVYRLSVSDPVPFQLLDAKLVAS